VNALLATWNQLNSEEASSQLRHCCASSQWAQKLTAMRPFPDEDSLFAASDCVWTAMREPDWMEAFQAHPRIGEKKVEATAQSRQWSLQEQGSAETAEFGIKQAMAHGNLRYEQIFGFTYIVCATGKDLLEMLNILETRLQHDRAAELAEAAEQQRQITQIRLRKWLNP